MHIQDPGKSEIGVRVRSIMTRREVVVRLKQKRFLVIITPILSKIS
jgi:hypothetical protein